MKEKLHLILNTLMGSMIGVCLGHGLYVLWDYKTHPGLYAMQSAPWYTSILTYSLFTVVGVGIVLLIKLFLRKQAANRK